MRSFNVLLLWLYSVNAIGQTWDEHVYMGKEEHANGNLQAAAELLEKAAVLKSRDNSEWFLYAAILHARMKHSDEAFDLLQKAADAGMFDIARLERNARLTRLQADPRWPELLRAIRAKENAYISAANLSHPRLRAELKGMWKLDQDAVGNWAQQKAAIDKNSARLSSMIDQYGWPKHSMVGRDGSWLAWAIVQHSFDLDLQRRCLRLIEAKLKRGEASPETYAELYDRILKNTEREQWYGMAIVEREDRNGFYPIAQPELVDERRKRIGLPPLEVWANINHVRMTALEREKR